MRCHDEHVGKANARIPGGSSLKMSPITSLPSIDVRASVHKLEG